MRKSNQFLATGSLLIILLGIVLWGGWQYFGTGQRIKLPVPEVSMCGGGWEQMPLEVAKNIPYRLQGVAAISSKDIWAVGDGLIEHWNGTQWQPALSEVVQHGTWNAITARSAHDIWAIGQTRSGAQAVHWDGKTWSATSLPMFASGVVTLTGIAAIAPGNAWMIGSSRSGMYPHEQYKPLMLHWDGKNWHEVAGVRISAGNTVQFAGISAVSATDIWVVGSSMAQTPISQEWIEHWDGHKWQQVSAPLDHSAYHNVTLRSVVGVSAHDVWAVGYGTFSGDETVSGASGVIEHWDGHKWSYSRISGPESRSNELVSIKAFAPTNIWAVGSFVNPNTRLGGAYMQHWDGKKWNIGIWPLSYGQLADNSSIGLTDVARAADGQMIAVGSSVVFTQNPPIDDAARNPVQPFVLKSCH